MSARKVKTRKSKSSENMAVAYVFYVFVGITYFIRFQMFTSDPMMLRKFNLQLPWDNIYFDPIFVIVSGFMSFLVTGVIIDRRAILRYVRRTYRSTRNDLLRTIKDWWKQR